MFKKPTFNTEYGHTQLDRWPLNSVKNLLAETDLDIFDMIGLIKNNDIPDFRKTPIQRVIDLANHSRLNCVKREEGYTNDDVILFLTRAVVYDVYFLA